MKAIVDGRTLSPNKRKELTENYDGILEFMIADEAKGIALVQREQTFLDADGKLVGLEIHIQKEEDMQRAMTMELPPEVSFIVFRTEDWTIIPLENVIAKFHDVDVIVGAPARSVEDLKLISTILEIGVDLALLEGEKIEEMLEWMTKSQTNLLNLEELEVIEIKKVGTADRVCVDTCAVLRKGEGLLVGNTSKLFALIEAEVEETGYVASRPFRVNAGAIAAYVLNSEKTNYLSELKAGSTVSVVSKIGTIREELVCRVKIERRPMILVKLRIDKIEAPIIVQDAETVRFVTSEGAVSVKDLDVGMKVLGVSQRRGRHFGMEVDEFIEEH